MDHVMSREQLENILEDHRDFLRMLYKWALACEPNSKEIANEIKAYLRIIK